MPGSSDVDAQPAATARASVTAAGGAPGGAEDALDALSALVADDLEACNRLIVERMQSPVALIPQLAAHIVAAGGKRLRPLLTLASARLCGHDGRRHVALAACVEFIHTATLLHDDVVDESALRRGQASANALFPWSVEIGAALGAEFGPLGRRVAGLDPGTLFLGASYIVGENLQGVRANFGFRF